MACTLRACCRASRIGCEQRTSHFLLRQPQPLSNFSQYSTSHMGASASSTTATSKHVRFLQTCSPRLRSQRDTPSEPPPTDFNEMDMLRGMPAPSTSVDVCMYDGFGLNSGITITNGDGALLVHGEAFRWRPWEARGSLVLTNKKGQFDIPFEAFGLFDLLWPRPDLLVLGVGKSNLPLSPETKMHITQLGMRVEVLDTRNAAAQFNLLATERGVSEVAAALIPMGWQDGVGAKA
ncbi:hypothetical protein E4U43_004823 [Claviceps pusilla]|uniref:NADH dehydrogenase [ubiquinone] 1 alpha subcomplex assembly factor 3 n=1 Tax=Claviceps pusilla TaxID=123648 RepID=A0A9P7N3E2_9HYPO|nr:hypothetical protein E4U43_004823 [Claviceps pusilla]